MREDKEPLTFEERWALAVRALNRHVADGWAKRLLANKEVAEAIEVCILETPVPEVHALSWLRNVLLRLSGKRTLHSLGRRRLAISDDILDTSFAAQKLAACTLAALRLQQKNRAMDEQLVSAWNEMQGVIEANMAKAFSRRDKLLQSRARSQAEPGASSFRG